VCLGHCRRAPNAKHDKVCPGGGRVMEMPGGGMARASACDT
jgi:hypothetical protein